jgi:NAD+ kinase|tara:strand:+ start:295 stop:1152 length:858 start_codon:yes stop_codon:yes gene_type:complete
MAKHKKIVFLGNIGDESSFLSIQSLIDKYQEKGIQAVLIDSLNNQDTDSKMQNAELIVSIGGDGTMLQSAKLAYQYDLPITGINKGRLGFLTDINPQEADQVLDDIISGNYTTENRILIEAFISTNSINKSIGYAFNDIVINRKETGRMIRVETSIDNSFINTHEGDGFIVATPTGSTAYSLSCGGPILKPDVEALLLVPICPHSLNDRPMVVPSSSEITLRYDSEQNVSAGIDLDGDTVYELKIGDNLVIKKAAKPICLIHPENYDYFDNLKSKLLWGKDKRHE